MITFAIDADDILIATIFFKMPWGSAFETDRFANTVSGKMPMLGTIETLSHLDLNMPLNCMSFEVVEQTIFS